MLKQTTVQTRTTSVAENVAQQIGFVVIRVQAVGHAEGEIERGDRHVGIDFPAAVFALRGFCRHVATVFRPGRDVSEVTLGEGAHFLYSHIPRYYDDRVVGVVVFFIE